MHHCKKYLYNKQQGTFCNRTPFNWCKYSLKIVTDCLNNINILVRFILYIVLLNSCVLGLLIIFTKIMTGIIKNISSLPLIAKSDFMKNPVPGLSFRPDLIAETSPLIWYKIDNPQERFAASKLNLPISDFVTQIDEILEGKVLLDS